MQRKTITIHVIDAPGGGLTVLTTACQGGPGRPQTPAEALATYLLGACINRGAAMHYWQGEDRALALARELADPEGYAHAATPEMHAHALYVLGRRTTPYPAAPIHPVPTPGKQPGSTQEL